MQATSTANVERTTLKTFDSATRRAMGELGNVDGMDGVRRGCGRQSLIKSGLVGHGFDWQTPVFGGYLHPLPSASSNPFVFTVLNLCSFLVLL